MPRFNPKIDVPPAQNAARKKQMGWTPSSEINYWRNQDSSEYQYMAIVKAPINLEIETKIYAALIKLLFVEAKWTKGALCRVGKKSWPRVQDKDVTCWCIVGALDLIKTKNPELLGLHADRLYNRLNALVRKLGFKCLEDFNDDPRVKHEHLMKFLQKAEGCLK